jgi:hypothetical protein
MLVSGAISLDPDGRRPICPTRLCDTENDLGTVRGMNLRPLPLLLLLACLNVAVVVAQTLEPASTVLQTTAEIEAAAIGIWLEMVRGRRQ